MEIEILEYRTINEYISFYIKFVDPVEIYRKDYIEGLLGKDLENVLLLFSLCKFDEIYKKFENIRLDNTKTRSIELLIYYEDYLCKTRSNNYLINKISKELFKFDDFNNSYYKSFWLIGSEGESFDGGEINNKERKKIKLLYPDIYKLINTDKMLKIIFDKLNILDNPLILKDKIDRNELFELLRLYLRYKIEENNEWKLF
jgi:hypothetical protein